MEEEEESSLCMRIKRPSKDRFNPVKVTAMPTRKIVDNEFNVRTLLLGQNSSKSEVNSTFEVEVLNLPIAIREDELKRHFLQFGKVATITQELLNRKAIIGFSSLDG
jgi:hypothetical protein